MANVKEFPYSSKKMIKDLPLGTVFKYQDKWYIRSDIYIPKDEGYTFDILGECVRYISTYIHYCAVDLISGEVSIPEQFRGYEYPETIADEINIKMKI